MTPVRADTTERLPTTEWIGAALAVSWLGVYLHNVQEFDLPIWSPEHSGPLAVAVLLGLTWWLRPGRGVGIVLVGWAVLNVLGGAVLTVLPLDVLPFEPEQSLTHYAAHAVYGLLQVPLVVHGFRAVRGGAATGVPPHSQDPPSR